MGEEEEVAGVVYKHALRRLRAAFPDELCDWSEDGMCEHRRVCPCTDRHCRGRVGWAWLLASPSSFGYGCNYGIDQEREAWLRAGDSLQRECDATEDVRDTELLL